MPEVSAASGCPSDGEFVFGKNGTVPYAGRGLKIPRSNRPRPDGRLGHGSAAHL